jgi:hypothetical protein
MPPFSVDVNSVAVDLSGAPGFTVGRAFEDAGVVGLTSVTEWNGTRLAGLLTRHLG